MTLFAASVYYFSFFSLICRFSPLIAHAITPRHAAVLLFSLSEFTLPPAAMMIISPDAALFDSSDTIDAAAAMLMPCRCRFDADAMMPPCRRLL